MKVEMEEWEVEAAKILGATCSQIKNMNREELHGLLEVSDKSLKKFYQYTGQRVIIDNMLVNLQVVLIPIGKSPPYKVFFKITISNIEIFLIRHAHQKPLV